MSAGCPVSRVTRPPAYPRKSLGRLLLSSLGRARSHGLGLKRAVAYVEITLEPVLALGFEQLFAELVVGRVRERAESSFEQQARVNSGGLHAHHGNGLVEPHRRLRHEADAFCERASGVHELIMRHHLVHHADAQRLLRVEMVAGEPPTVGGLPTAQRAEEKCRGRKSTRLNSSLGRIAYA